MDCEIIQIVMNLKASFLIPLKNAITIKLWIWWKMNYIEECLSNTIWNDSEDKGIDLLDEGIRLDDEDESTLIVQCIL